MIDNSLAELFPFGFVLCILFIVLAIIIGKNKKLKPFSFSFYVLAAVSFALQYPTAIVTLGEFKTKNLIIPLLQIIMFGMGTTMSLQDFYGVIKMPKGVFIGLLCQFSIMPVVGYSLSVFFYFPPEIAAGIILIGSCPGGLASNVMAYLAKANVALSISLTTIATLLAPIVTPALMKFFAGTLIPIDTWVMMISILKMVILPVLLGLIFNQLLKKQARYLLSFLPQISMFAIIGIIMIITANGRDSLLTVGLSLFCAAVIHNVVGYILGYLSCKLLRLPDQDCRTIAFEVGMQNGGLASGIAVQMGQVATLGLAPAIFGPWMNISGSSLALWWKGRLKT